MENKQPTIKAITGNKAERSTYFPGQNELQAIEKYFKDASFEKKGRYGGTFVCKVPKFVLFADKAIRDDYFRAMDDELNTKEAEKDSTRKLLAILRNDTIREAWYDKMVFEIGMAAEQLRPFAYKRTLPIINSLTGTRRYIYLDPTGSEKVNLSTEFFTDRTIKEENIIDLTGKYQEILAKHNQTSKLGRR